MNAAEKAAQTRQAQGFDPVVSDPTTVAAVVSIVKTNGAPVLAGAPSYKGGVRGSEHHQRA